MFQKTYAIDWDGTIVDEGLYPSIGEPKPNCINVMKKIVESGARIIIWTCRGGQDELIKNKLNEHGFYDFIINQSYQDVYDAFDTKSDKAYADVYIDDRGLFAREIDWYEIEEILFGKAIDK